MPQKITNTLYWLLSLGKVFTRNAPLATFAVMTMTFISQLCTILAFLLPIKVVMLIGTSGEWNILPIPIQNTEKDLLILWMGVITLLLYGAMHLTQRLSTKASTFGVKTLLEKNQKLVLFENQHEIASNAYSRYADGLAGINFSLFGLLFLGFIYRDVAAVLLVAIIVFILGLAVLSKTRASIKNKLGEHANQIVGWLADFGFMVVFVYIVIDFLYLTPPTFILAIIAIILTRILLGRLQFSLNQFIALVKQEHHINALFFHHDDFKSKKTKISSVWDLISSPMLTSRLKNLIEDAISHDIKSIELEIRDSNTKDVALLTAKVPDLDRSFLIKLFGSKTNVRAIHEATLILEYADQLPIPCPIKITTIKQHHCHIFDISNMSYYSPKKQGFENTKSLLIEKLALVELTDDFITRYGRSKPFTWEKIDQELFQRLEAVSSGTELQMIADLRVEVPKIIEILKSLPLTIDVPINKEMVIFSQKGDPLLIDWTKWQLAPLGACIIPDKKLRAPSLSIELNQQINKLITAENEQIHPKNIELSSLINSLLLKYDSQRYREIINTLLPIIDSNLSQTYRNKNSPVKSFLTEIHLIDKLKDKESND